MDEATRRTAAEEAQQAQARADREAKRLLTGQLKERAFTQDLEEYLEDAVYVADLSWKDMRALLPHRETHTIGIDRVEGVGEITVGKARRLSDRVLADITARMLVSVSAQLPTAVAASIDEDEAMVFEGSDEYGDARASALRTVIGHFEGVFDTSLREIQSVRLRTLSRARR